MIDNTRWHWNDNIKSIKNTLFSNFNSETGGIDLSLWTAQRDWFSVMYKHMNA